MVERAEVAGQFPPRPALYDDPALAAALKIPAAEARRIIEAAVPRPVYAGLQPAVEHPAAVAASGPHPAAGAAGGAARRGDRDARAARAAAAGGIMRSRRRRRAGGGRHAAGVGADAAGAVGDRGGGAVPDLWTGWESLHFHDLRMPWLGRPFVGVQNYVDAARRAAVLGRPRPHRRVRRRHAGDRAVGRAAAGAGARPRDPGPRAGPHGRAAAVGDPHGGGGAGLAVHLREPLRPGQRAGGRSRPRGADLVRGCDLRLAAAGAGRRLEDHAVRGGAAAGRSADDRPRALRGRAVDGAGGWRQFTRSRCRCWRRRWSWPDCSARSTPFASSTWCT